MSRRIVIGIYLAAGQSKRMGCPKLSLPIGTAALGSLALHAAVQSNLERVLVLIRPDDPLDWIDPVLVAPPQFNKWNSVICNDAALGQAYSLRCGILAAIELGADAIVILLADQPFVTKEMINKLIDQYMPSDCQSELGYIAASFQSVARPPVLFASMLFPQLLQLDGDQGARMLFRHCQSEQALPSHRSTPAFPGKIVRFEDEMPFLDVDTPAAYKALLKKLDPDDLPLI